MDWKTAEDGEDIALAGSLFQFGIVFTTAGESIGVTNSRKWMYLGQWPALPGVG